MATTDRNLLPYPVGTDPVRDGDNAIQALAEKVNPLIVSWNRYGSLLTNNSTGLSPSALRITSHRGSATTNAFGQIQIITTGHGAVMGLLGVAQNTTAVIKPDMTNLSGTSILVIVYRVDTGAVLANTAVDYWIAVFGLSAV